MASQTDRFSPFDKSRLSYYEKAPHEEDTSHQVSDVEDISIGLAEDLSFLISGPDHGGPRLGTADIKIVYPEDVTSDTALEQRANVHLGEDGDQHILIGNITDPSTVSGSPGMRHVGLRGDECYYSGCQGTGKNSTFDIYYKIHGDRYPRHQTGYVELRQSYELLQFRFNVSNGQATYSIACNEDAYGQYVAPMNDQEFSLDGRTHPFAIHLVLLAKTINTQGTENDKTLRRLTMLEEKYLRVLHGLLLHLVISTNKNSKYLSFIKNLMLDLERLRKFPESIEGAFAVDSYSHERLVNGFKSLEDYCQNRGNRLASRQHRVQNLVNLTYNLLANRDSKVNSDIARESAVIAYGTRKDGASMITIAVLGMVFLPSTFVSTILGSNLFALEDNGAGEHSFVVSDLWWIYLAIALPLTLITMGIWGLCLKFRTQWIKKGRSKEAQDMA